MAAVMMKPTSHNPAHHKQNKAKEIESRKLKEGGILQQENNSNLEIQPGRGTSI